MNRKSIHRSDNRRRPGAWLLSGLVAAIVFVHPLAAQKKLPPPSPVSYKGRVLSYTPDAWGNRIPDFSYAGYQGGEVAIPLVPTRAWVPLTSGDATARIQAAIDYIAGLQPDPQGFRGAVQLEKGTYQLTGRLAIHTSGIVLRGAGSGTNGTTLVAAGTDRETLITISGESSRPEPPIRITDAYVPVNATRLQLADAVVVKAGDAIAIRRPSTQAWIDLLGTRSFGGGLSALGWKPGDRDIVWNRKVTAVEGNRITIDAPITTALDTTYGGGTVSVYRQPRWISQVGVENLQLRSAYDPANPRDEAHCWMAITLNQVRDAWVRQVVFRHFAGSATAIWEEAARVTVEDCRSLAPVSEIGGQRRNTFFTMGTQTLFQRCYAESGYHDFATGFCAAGPNAFVQCTSYRPYDFSGAIDSWASGILFDKSNVDGQALRYGNREQDGQGAGWAAANSVFWQCSAARIDCYQPPGAQNWAFGTWAQFAGNGYWENSNETIQPPSLYYAQLEARLGASQAGRSQLLLNETNATSSPSAAQAAELTRFAENPLPTIADWIADAAKRNPIPVAFSGKKIETGFPKTAVTGIAAAPLLVKNGWLVRGHAVQTTGNRYEAPWWTGGILPTDLPKMKPAITRFVPGRTGQGFTDDLASFTDTMVQQHRTVFEQNYALWYERRRDDHERIRRMNGDVWPPFYELPFARTGKDTAWDGLSKYDLTRYNTWYWRRLQQFADLADTKGLVLIHKHYFQHNIIEAGAHYADFPWRPVNNINQTGFPEPVPYAGDKRVFMAAPFYDTAHALRKKLHQAYIYQCLNNFRNNRSVIQEIGEEFTGPLPFVQFWVDAIRQWRATSKQPQLIALATTRDVQDAILADPKRAAVIDIIDIRYWHYQYDSTAYAPQGGQNLAPRQHARLLKPRRSSFSQVYRAVEEYRTRFPGKAVLYSGDGYDQFGWAVLMAGGSLPHLPANTVPGLLEAVSGMLPVAAATNGLWLLKGSNGLVAYTENAAPIPLDLSGWKGQLKIHWIDIKNGSTLKEETVAGGRKISLDAPGREGVVVWVER